MTSTSGKTTKKRDPRAHHPTKQTLASVKALASFGVKHDEIAAFIGITLPTLYKYYRKELDGAATHANMLVANSLFNKARGDGPGSVTAAIFWLKARCGWRDRDPTPMEDGATAAPKVGKKEQAQLEAQAAIGGESDWGDLLRPGGLAN